MEHPKCITALADIDNWRQAILDSVDAARLAEEAVGAFPEMDITVTARAEPWASPIELSLMAKHVNDVVPLLRWFADRGYRRKGDPRDIGSINVRRWPLGKITVDVTFIGEACRYVKVGETTEPVYELQCPDEKGGAG